MKLKLKKKYVSFGNYRIKITLFTTIFLLLYKYDIKFTEFLNLLTTIPTHLRYDSIKQYINIVPTYLSLDPIKDYIIMVLENFKSYLIKTTKFSTTKINSFVSSPKENVRSFVSFFTEFLRTWGQKSFRVILNDILGKSGETNTEEMYQETLKRMKDTKDKEYNPWVYIYV